MCKITCEFFGFSSLFKIIYFLNRGEIGNTEFFPNHAGFFGSSNNGFYKTIANDAVKTICVSIYHAFNITRFCPVESSFCVCAVLSHLHCGGKSCEIRIDRCNNSAHKFADRNALNLFGFGAIGVHYGNENNFNVGVALEDSIKSTCVVENERYCDIKNNVGKFGRRRVSCESNLYFFYHFHNVSL